MTANIVTEVLDAQVLSYFPPELKASHRYIAHCFCIQCKEDSSQFLDVLNAAEQDYTFPVSSCSPVYPVPIATKSSLAKQESSPKEWNSPNAMQKHQKVASNATAECTREQECDTDWENAAVLSKEHNPPLYLLLGSSSIQTNPNNTNTKEGMLPLIYMRSLHHKLCIEIIIARPFTPIVSMECVRLPEHLFPLLLGQ